MSVSPCRQTDKNSSTMTGHDEPAPELRPDVEDVAAERKRKHTLGNVRLRHHETNDLVLIPTPSKDPNDPLNWSQPYKHYMAFLVCLAMMVCNFLAAGKMGTYFPARNSWISELT